MVRLWIPILILLVAVLSYQLLQYYRSRGFVSSSNDNLYNRSQVPVGSGEMFDSIAPYYDSINRLISLGMHHSWRVTLVKLLSLTSSDTILDIATGTGDVAISMLDSMSEPLVTPLQILDPSFKMLLKAKDKLFALGYLDSVQITLGDVTEMSSFESDRFTKISMSFGIRNVVDRESALAEIYRVIRKGSASSATFVRSKLAILEVFQPRTGILAPLASLFIHQVVPFIGAIFSNGHMREYNHLRQSIADFPPPPAFMGMLSAAGFVDCVDHDLIFDVVHVFVCYA